MGRALAESQGDRGGTQQAMVLVQAVLLQVKHKDSIQAVSTREAHDVLARLRAEHVTFKDLSYDPSFDWRGYLKGRSDFEEIVGPGITRFMFMGWPDIPDPKHDRRRCDFVLHRLDWISIRLHPAKSGHQLKPVWGAPGRWELDWARGRAPPTDSVPQGDRIGRKRARKFLEEMAAEMRACGETTRDLTDGDNFAWRSWLLSMQHSKYTFLPATRFEIELVDDGPRFLLTTPYKHCSEVVLALVPREGSTTVSRVCVTDHYGACARSCGGLPSNRAGSCVCMCLR